MTNFFPWMMDGRGPTTTIVFFLMVSIWSAKRNKQGVT